MGRSQVLTQEHCHHPDHAGGGGVTKPQRSRRTCPGLPLPRQTPCWITGAREAYPGLAASLLVLSSRGRGQPSPLQPPGQLPLSAHTSRSGGSKKPLQPGFFLAFLQLWWQIALQVSQPTSHLSAKNSITRLDLGWVSREGTFPAPPMCHGCPSLSKSHSAREPAVWSGAKRNAKDV